MLRWVLALILAVPFARTVRADDKPTRYQSMLARECDALLASAVKHPYGWGWGQTVEGDDGRKLPPRSVGVSLEPGETPAAGLVLALSGELLEKPKYVDAARSVARGLSAAQRANGKFPSLAYYGPSSVGANETLSPLPDRGATRASLGLLLNMMGDPGGDPGVIGRAAARGTKWLLKQQAETGAWVILWPPGVDVRDTTRLVRLDTADTRDSTLAVLLAYETLGDPFQRRAAERSLEYLMKARTGLGSGVGGGLWQTAYVPAGSPVEKNADFPAGSDLLASRYSMQTLLAVWAVLGDGQRLIAAGQAATSIEKLVSGGDGKWHRRYDDKGASTDPKPAENTFGPIEEVVVGSDPSLAEALAAVEAGKGAGREKFRERLGETFSLKQRLALVLCGLSDEAMEVDFPVAAGDVERYLKLHAEEFRLIEQPNEAAGDLGSRVRRLWAIYLRARVERRLGV